MVVCPTMVTPFCSLHPGPMCTCGPTTQNGPISTSSAICALASIMACGETRITPSTLPSIATCKSQLANPLHWLRVNEHELDVCLGGQLVFDKRLASDVTGAAFDTHGDRFEDQLVPRHHRVPHLHLIHAQHHRNFSGMLQLLAQQYTAKLGQCLHDQHTRHDRSPGVMALEENIVERHVLDAHRTLIADQLQDAIDHQHRIPMGEDTLNPADIQGPIAAK